MVMRVATFFPFQTTYYLNGHSYIEQELNRAQIGFRKNDNVPSKLARSACANPAQVRPSKSPGSECCVRRR